MNMKRVKDQEGKGLTRRVAFFVALMTIEVSVWKLLRSVRRFDRRGGIGSPRLCRGSLFRLFSRSLLWWLEIVFWSLLALFRVFLFRRGLGGNGISVALSELPFLGVDGGIHVRLGEFAFEGWCIRGGHVDVSDGVGSGFAFSHRFPSDYRKRVECSRQTMDTSTRTHLKGIST